jgi:hypothetical protein
MTEAARVAIAARLPGFGELALYDQYRVAHMALRAGLGAATSVAPIDGEDTQEIDDRAWLVAIIAESERRDLPRVARRQRRILARLDAAVETVHG